MSAADTLYALAFSPDGSHLVGATSRGLLLIWKLASSASAAVRSDTCIFEEAARSNPCAGEIVES